MATTGLYRGFSSYNYQTNKSFVLTDIDLVEMDILNHIYTTRRSRVMMPGFGTRIPEMAFEPLDEQTLLIIEEDLRAVAEFDPRVRLISLNIDPDYDNNVVTATMKLLYVELNMTKDTELNITFESN